ncbi:hypothetical protein EHQ53_07800 [Leptospira langatensis]|uniref:Uncharacterized protein n=1 Tax=Leptospira langatensis TaxID=2484983 RepID=A0A5F1ZUF5_9LEPT|nr:hypothetical protein [Leptospira langatensis]TGK01457.1 hypothetical protein EHO57_11070 [Leptospira langatensis]TGL42093.1 hypothetical protein EHQ53_07800 [Leptospira langatensis]
MAKKSDSKKDLLKKAAGDAVRKTLGGEVRTPDETPSPNPPQDVRKQEPEIPKETESRPLDQEKSREKQLPKKEPLFKVNNDMRIEEYTQIGNRDSNGNKKWIRILGVFLVVAFVWWIWPSKHEIYMDVDKMSPDKVSGMTSEKEYHFTHGQDFFIYYKRGGWFSPDKIKLTIYKVDDSREEISVQEKDFKRRFDKFQTYYDDSFFDEEGAYEVEIKNEEDEILVTKKFTID